MSAGRAVDRVAHPPWGAPSGWAAAEAVARRVRAAGGTLVATGGCFDLAHAGHVRALSAAAGLGDALVVLVNDDDSVTRLKGPNRPVQTLTDRIDVLSALECVAAVVGFGEDSPVEALQRLRPDLWVKGGDYAGADLRRPRSWRSGPARWPWCPSSTAGPRPACSTDSMPGEPQPARSTHEQNSPRHRWRQRPRRRRRPRADRAWRHGVGAGPAGGDRVSLGDRRPGRRPCRATGTDACGPLGGVDAATWERVVAVNLFGTAAVVRAALPALEAGHGRVVTVASTLGLKAVGDATAYCASKFGVVGFTRALATELAGRVGVTLLIPGGMRTAFVDDRTEQYRPGADARLTDPAHVAAVVPAAIDSPAGVELREIVVATDTEPSWP